MKKQILICSATILAALAQIAFIGINGLTLISIPITLFLGLEIIEKLTENKSNC